MHRIFAATFIVGLAWAGAGCVRREGPPLATEPTAAPRVANPAGERGPSLEFALEPVDREFDHAPESVALHGKRAVVLVITTYDVGSLLALRTLAPMLNELPADAGCLIVALQPIGDRPLVASFMDVEKHPCRRAIGDPKRGRIGDLARVTTIPTVLVLRKDGTLAGAVTGSFTADDVRVVLDRAS